MARVPKSVLLSISEDIEKNYSDMVDELLINLAKHLSYDVGYEEYYAFRKLALLDEITEQSIEIIAKYSGLSVNEVKNIFNYISELSLEDIDPLLEEASNKGAIQEVNSGLVDSVVDEHTTDTNDKLNAMRYTILNSTIQSYEYAVQQISYKTMQKISYSEASPILEEAGRANYDREMTQIEAIEWAIENMADEGLTGYIDRAGRHWSPEAYASMVVRTSAHNVAIDSIRARQEEYGSDYFQVSSHAGARPLCYPYQNKIFSWSAITGGYFYDGAGVLQHYGSLQYDSSYGEPAGLFGINCGHYPLPIIPNVSIVHDQPVQSKEENDREYKESQQQRYYERQIRNAKREYEMLKSAGASSDTLKDARAKIDNAQDNVREFIDETGRTRRYDREKVSVSSNTEKASSNYEELRLGNLDIKVPSTSANSNSNIEIARSDVFFTAKGYNGVEVICDKDQFGRKTGKHAKDFELNPSTASDRDIFRDIIVDIIENPDKVKAGSWSGYEGDSDFYIKGSNVVVVSSNNKFITILEGGINNARIKNARDK